MSEGGTESSYRRHCSVPGSGPIGVVTLRTNLEIGECAEYLITSDRHIDAVESDRAMQRRHLEQARARGARVLDFGDATDEMQGRRDPRKDARDLHPAIAARIAEGVPYYDAVCDEVVDFLRPYADLFDYMGEGNHESSITHHNETDIHKRIVARLNEEPGANIIAGGYEDMWRILNYDRAGKRRGRVLHGFTTHGQGGAAEVTKGTIRSQRRQYDVPADFYISGHTHQQYALITSQMQLVGATPDVRNVLHIQVPSYKGRAGQWSRERSTAFLPRGAYWLRVWAIPSSTHKDMTLALSAENAV